jgi:23S rRNA (cytosine1962-C5)-methyltransferase
MMPNYPSIMLRPEKKGTFLARHPWVLSRSILPPKEPLQDGQVVDLVLPDGQFVARGIYNGRSRICVRLYSWNRREPLDDVFWASRLRCAIELRHQLGLDRPGQAARLVFSEGDGLSGLIVDRYSDYLVVQVTSLGMQQRLEPLVGWLAEHVRPTGIVARIDRKVIGAEGLGEQGDLLWGTAPSGPVTIEEHGIKLEVDLTAGQKTGYYLDQRENRLEAARYAAGRRVLDVCCYAGGFSLAVGRLGGAAEALGIDSSERAVERAREHARANDLSNVQFETADCFDRLESLASERRMFDMVVLDPPRFAASRRNLDAALRAYHRLNRLAMDRLEPGGILVTCSCSGAVTRDDFWHVLAGVQQRTGRELQVLAQRGASPDHPVHLACPETDYLKCFICRVRM